MGKWRWRFKTHRLEGLRAEPRPGAPRSIDNARIEAVIVKLCKASTAATHWSLRGMAQASGLWVSSVQRIWRAFGLQPHRLKTLKLSTDPDFVAKVRDVVGLYVSPPNRAIALCVDEKSQIQALDRSQPMLRCARARQPGAMADSTAVRAHRCASGVNVWPARLQAVSSIRSEQSASTYPVSGLTWPRWRAACPEPYKGAGIKCHFTRRLTGHRLTVRPSRFHHPQTLLRLATSGDRRQPSPVPPPLARQASDPVLVRSNAHAIRASLLASATTTVLPWARASRPRN